MFNGWLREDNQWNLTWSWEGRDLKYDDTERIQRGRFERRGLRGIEDPLNLEFAQENRNIEHPSKEIKKIVKIIIIIIIIVIIIEN